MPRKQAFGALVMQRAITAVGHKTDSAPGLLRVGQERRQPLPPQGAVIPGAPNPPLLDLCLLLFPLYRRWSMRPLRVAA